MMVLVTEIASATNAESKSEKFRRKKLTEKPTANVPNASHVAIVNAFFPILRSLSIGNSIPTTNNKRIIPISANKFKISGFNIKLNGGVCGPMIIPARI